MQDDVKALKEHFQTNVSKVSELRGELFNVKVKRATGQLENTALAGNLRRDIARAETVLRQLRGENS